MMAYLLIIILFVIFSILYKRNNASNKCLNCNKCGGSCFEKNKLK